MKKIYYIYISFLLVLSLLMVSCGFAKNNNIQDIQTGDSNKVNAGNEDNIENDNNGKNNSEDGKSGISWDIPPISVERVVYTDNKNFTPPIKSDTEFTNMENKLIEINSESILLTYKRSKNVSSELFDSVKQANTIDIYEDENGGKYQFYSGTDILVEYYSKKDNIKPDNSEQIKDKDGELLQIGKNFIEKNSKLNLDQYRLAENSGIKDNEYCFARYTLYICGYETNADVSIYVNSEGKVYDYVDWNKAILYEQYIDRVTEDDIKAAIAYAETSGLLTAQDVHEKDILVVGNDGYLYVWINTLRYIPDEIKISDDGSEEIISPGRWVEGLSCYVRVIPSK